MTKISYEDLWRLQAMIQQLNEAMPSIVDELVQLRACCDKDESNKPKESA